MEFRSLSLSSPRRSRQNGNLLGFPNSVSNQPSQQVQRYMAPGEPFPAAGRPSHAIGFHPKARETCASRRGRGHQRVGFILEVAEGEGLAKNMLCPKAAWLIYGN